MTVSGSPPASAPGAKPFVWLCVALALAFTVQLGTRGLNEPDEGRYANISAAFLEPGRDQWEPRMSDFAHYDKPPLVYWTTALAFRAFGVNEWAARLTPLLGAFASLAGLGWAARRLYGREVAFWSLLICGSLGQFWFLGRFLSPDMLLTGFCSLAVGSWAESRHRGGDWKFWSLSLVFWSLAWWTKATAALVPFAGLFVGVLLTRDRIGLRALKPWLILPGILVLGSPWYLQMMREHPETVQFFFGRELAGRIAGHADGRRGPIYYYVLLSFGAWAPWLPVLLIAWLSKWKQLSPGGWRSWPAKLGVEGVLVITGLTIFSLISSKLPTYTLPLAPWAALLFARGLLRLREVISERAFFWFTRSVAACFVLVVAGLLVTVPRLEGDIGLSSTMRPIGARLRELGATSVFVDRYFAGMEIYFGKPVRYVVPRAPQQRASDTGICAATGDTHFSTFEEFETKLARESGADVWLVHYDNRKPNNASPILKYIRTHEPLAREQLGDFVLWRVR